MLKWRDVISIQHNCFATWAKIVDTCLQQSITFSLSVLPTYSFQQSAGSGTRRVTLEPTLRHKNVLGKRH